MDFSIWINLHLKVISQPSLKQHVTIATRPNHVCPRLFIVSRTKTSFSRLGEALIHETTQMLKSLKD